MAAQPPASIGSFDYIVVGAGAAGCLLANRLSADPSVTVLLVEAGGEDDYRWIYIPLGIFKTHGNPGFDWCFQSEPEPGLNGRRINVPRGKVLGGSTAINGMVYMRGQARDYDRWRAAGNPGWGWADVLPYFKRFEDYCHGADEVHGAGGEWRIEEMRTSWKILDAYAQAAVEVGLARTRDFNRGDNEGTGYCQVTQRRGVRVSAASAFLHPVRRRPNLHLLTGALATAVRFEGRRAAGIEFRQGGEPRYAAARAEVILAAGTIGSPQLLQLSGVGPGALLQSLGIALRHDVPGVGENLQDHFLLRMVHRFSNERSLNQVLRSPLGRAGMALEYFLFKRGPMSMIPPLMNVFAKSDPSRESANVQIQASAASFERPGAPPHPFPGFTGGACNLRPASRGYVRVRGADPGAAPAILHNYLDAEDDRRVAVGILKLMRRIASARALAPYRPEEYRPGPQARSDAELLAFARENGNTVFHPVGTCKMGHDALAVVDERLRVRGLQALRVADASIMPTICSGNTNSATLMIAEKAADLIKEDRRARLTAPRAEEAVTA